MTRSVPTDPDYLALQAALPGEYSIQRELGRRGMGVVQLAREAGGLSRAPSA